MCGISGYFHLKTKLPSEVEARIEKVKGSLLHRGPDYQNHKVYEQGIFVHTRLAINDLTENGNQPFESDSLDLIFNGEIYDFESKSEIIDHQMKSSTDFECLIPLFEKFNAGSFKKLNGIFSFSIFDKVRNKLYLCRDPFGVKPLYYFLDNEKIIFGSEIKSILAWHPEKIEVSNPSELMDFFRLGYFPGDQTGFKGIKKLNPGFYLEIDLASGQSNKVEYYTYPSFVSYEDSEQRAQGELSELLNGSFIEQLNSDVPIGVMLSGGLDSAILCALYKKYYKGTLFTFSLSFQDKEFNEIDYANKIAEKFSDQHIEIPVTAENYKDAFYHSLVHMDLPSGDSSAVPIYLLAKEASMHVTVLLSGDGGDEFHAGYDTLKAHSYARLYKFLPKLLRKNIIKPLIDSVPDSFSSISPTNLAKLFVSGADEHPAVSYLVWREMIPLETQRKLFSFTNKSKLEDEFIEKYESYKGDPINQSLLLDAHYHFGDKTQHKTDGQTMAWSLETRVPLADKRLVDFNFKIPGNYKFKGLVGKSLLRRIFEDELPKEVLEKKKRGLLVPYAKWMKGPWKDWLNDVYSWGEKHLSDSINFEYVWTLYREHTSGINDHSRILYVLLSYIEWNRLYSHTQDYKDFLTQSRAPRV